MSLELKFRITLNSDYHISAGHGLGAGVDSALLRDADGVPVIRGTTLTGLLRDGLWRLLQQKPMQDLRKCVDSGLSKTEGKRQQYCGQNHPNGSVDLCPLCRLFGTPRDPKRWFVQSARPENKGRVAVPRKSSARGSVVQRVSINPRTRRAKPRQLFSQEDGQSENEFIFSITCAVSDKSAMDEAALWVAAARNVRELGRSRNRGQGDCLFSLIDMVGSKETYADWQTALLDRFAEKWLDGGKPASRDVATTTYTSPDLTNAAKTPVRVRLIIRIDEPLLIAENAEAGNMFDSRDTIPGATIRGALAWLAANRFDLDEGNPVYEPFVETFLRDQVNFPYLYPARWHKSRLFPVVPRPRDLYTCKVYPGKKPRRHGIWFATLGQLPANGKCPQCESPLTNKSRFVCLSEVDWESRDDFDFTVKRRAEMHIQIDPHTRRVSEGQLFGYVALDVGQYFIGDIICRNEASWEQLLALTGLSPESPETLQIGKASRRGYGKVTAWFEIIDNKEGTWRGLPLEERHIKGKELTLTLLTDTIVLDNWGRYATGFDTKWLEKELKLKVEKIGYAEAHHRLMDGFNAHLGLPRWRDVALTAGSTVRLHLAEPPDFASLRALERDGIGLRRSEGFGQIAFNHPVYQHCKGITRGIKLDKEMEPHLKYENRLANFRKDWTKKLDEKSWNRCSDSRFASVARWLRTSQDASPEKLAAELKQLGTASETWQNEYILDYGDRTKENKLQAREKGISLVGELLNELNGNDEAFWSTGIEMVADRIAEVAGEKSE